MTPLWRWGGTHSRPQVLVAGGGVAALETVFALRAVAGDRVAITLLCPAARFINRSMAVDQPATVGRVRGVKLRDVADDLGVTWRRGSLDRVDCGRHLIGTAAGDELSYDRLVIAVGARPDRRRASGDVLVFQRADDAYEYRRLIRLLEAGRVRRLAFVQPRAVSGPLALYQLALDTAAHAAALDIDLELSFVTPEPSPLEVFGPEVSALATRLLDDAGIRLYAGSEGVPSRPGRLHLSPGGRRIAVERVVTLPRLRGPRVPGVPADPAGFIRTDAYARVVGAENVYAAGDATDFPIKQGGLAAQQADVAAAAIAASVGVRVAARPFRPVLRGLLVAGGTTQYLRARLGEETSDEIAVSRQPLWWPPNRLCGRFLAPYLSSVAGGAAMFQQGAPRAVTHPTRDGSTLFAELVDLPGI
jgi:sulfide:quinone oxidoreductase